MLGRDFNLLMNEKMDLKSSTQHKAQKALLMRKCSKDIGILVWQTSNPIQRDYTYYSSVTGNYARLDLSTVKSIKIGKYIYHVPLQMTLRISKEKGAGIWRLNNSLLL